MKLKRITLACIGVFGVPTFAAAQSLSASAPLESVQIYGTINVDVESVEAKGAASGQNFDRRARVTSNSSNIGFRGREQLGYGLAAWFQVESQVNVDDGTSSGFWASRNSGVGLQGNWGQFLLGQWDSPYKISTVRFDPTGDVGIAGYSGIMGSTGAVTAGQGGSNFAQRASFERRVSNVIQYWTPTWSGLSGRLAYGATDTSLGSPSTGVAESTNLKPNLWSAMAAYESGPLYATLAFEQHKDFQSLNTLFAAPASGGRDRAWKAGVSYKFANAFTVGGIFESLEYRADDINGLGEVKRKVDNWYLVGKYETGPHNIAVSYGQKGKEKLSGAGLSDLDDSKAHQISARYSYSFSKRTQLYAIATVITNESNAFQNFGNSPITPTTLFLDPSRGADPTGYGVGMIHSF
jgi:predicted porin